MGVGDLIDLRAGRIRALARAMWPILESARCLTSVVDAGDVYTWASAAKLAGQTQGVNVNTMLYGVEPCVMAAYLDDWEPNGRAADFGRWEIAVQPRPW